MATACNSLGQAEWDLWWTKRTGSRTSFFPFNMPLSLQSFPKIQDLKITGLRSVPGSYFKNEDPEM
jgi:hypothetical protein